MFSSSEYEQYDVVIIGGGFFGCAIAIFLRKFFKKILLIEKNHDFLQEASLNNQARVHNGYHYPRSFMTAARSHINFARFVHDFSSCIDESFTQYYAIAKKNSKINALAFSNFCNRIGAKYERASKEVGILFNKDLIEDVFRVEECAFDAERLKNFMKQRLFEENIQTFLGRSVEKIMQNIDGTLDVMLERKENSMQRVKTKNVFNCTYSSLNILNKKSALPLVPLKYELTEIALFDAPPIFKDIGVKISNIRIRPGNLPLLEDCHYKDSLWEIKTILPQNEINDGRPILFKKNHGFKNYTCILGGKIDNIYDVFDELSCLFGVLQT